MVAKNKAFGTYEAAAITNINRINSMGDASATVDLKYRVRPLVVQDYPRVISSVDGWWGKLVSPMLPRLFFEHFCDTSFAVVLRDKRLSAKIATPTSTTATDPTGATAQGREDEVVGFLCGFISQAKAGEVREYVDDLLRL